MYTKSLSEPINSNLMIHGHFGKSCTIVMLIYIDSYVTVYKYLWTTAVYSVTVKQ